MYRILCHLLMYFMPPIQVFHVFFACLQSLIEAHDVISSELYSEESRRVTPPPTMPYLNGDSGLDADGELNEELNMDNVTRVRLVQFQRNSEEPLVRYCIITFITHY